MKNPVLFSSKDKSKTIKCRLLQSLFDTLRVKVFLYVIEKFRIDSLVLLLLLCCCFTSTVNS